MTAERFKEMFSSRTYLQDKFGLAYYLVSDVININKAEELVTKYGYTVERQTDDYVSRYFLWSKVFYDGKLVGAIDLQGFPSIEFSKRTRKIITNSNITQDDLVIKPIIGIHRILDWHTVKGKMHCLAGGETILHLMPTELTDELIQEWVEKLDLQPIVEKTKNKL